MIYLNLPLGSRHGWGVCGKYLARELSKLEPARLLTEPFDVDTVGDALEYHELQELALPADEAARRGDKLLDGPLVQGIADHTLVPLEPGLRSRTVLGYTFFELNLLRPEWIENARRFFHRVVTGSSWCAQTLKQAGLAHVSTVIQGVDPTVFYPTTDGAKTREYLADKFVVFSGGKFELRKGQDIVIRAFKVLQERHRDVVLVNAWYNPWPATMETMQASGLLRLQPRSGSYVEVINGILADNGIDLRRVITVPPQPNAAMARLYRNTDVGLFPNRCEGGTNLVLMEYMACGQPVIAVDTTGHRDIVNSGNALVIACHRQTTVNLNGRPAACWPEPDLDDTIAKLEWAYQNREAIRRLGRQAGRDLAGRTWRRTAETFQQLIRETADPCDEAASVVSPNRATACATAASI